MFKKNIKGYKFIQAINSSSYIMPIYIHYYKSKSKITLYRCLIYFNCIHKPITTFKTVTDFIVEYKIIIYLLFRNELEV